MPPVLAGRMEPRRRSGLRTALRRRIRPSDPPRGQLERRRRRQRHPGAQQRPLQIRRPVRGVRSRAESRRTGTFGHLARQRRKRRAEPRRRSHRTFRLGFRGRTPESGGHMERPVQPPDCKDQRPARKGPFLQQHVPCDLQPQHVERRKRPVGFDRRQSAHRGRSLGRRHAGLRRILEHCSGTSTSSGTS